MTEQHPPDRFEIVFELPPSPKGTYQHRRVDGTTVRGDASGEWTLGEDGEIADIVFFASPRWMRRDAEHAGDKRTRSEPYCAASRVRAEEK